MFKWQTLSLDVPSLGQAVNSDNDNAREFLGLLKTYERTKKQCDDTNNSNTTDLESLESRVVQCLQSLQSSCLRKGLLQGNVDRAAELISNAEKQNMKKNTNQQNNGNKRRKRGGGSGNKSIAIFDENYITNFESGVAVGNEMLIISALNKILGSSSKESQIFSYSIIQVAADVLMSICQFVNTNIHQIRNNVSIQVEHDLIFGMHIQFLNGLVNTMNFVLKRMDNEDESNEVDVHADVVSSCCKAAARIISIVGTKLSRKKVLIEKVKSTADTVLFHRNIHQLGMESSAMLLATLPLTGNMDGTPPQKLWTELVEQKSQSLCRVLNYFFPLQRSSVLHGSATKEEQTWINVVREKMINQSERIIEFQRRVEGTAVLLLHLLNMDIYNQNSQLMLSHASVPAKLLLDLTELMLAFPSVAETKYLSTKSRLCDISVENGLLSPNAAMMVANTVRFFGHDLYDASVTIFQNNGLFHGKRIIRIAFASLQSCSSYAVRKTVDQSILEKHFQGKKRRWLHCSLELRIKAIKSIKVMITSIGSNAVTTQGSIIDKVLKLIAGCLLEQIDVQAPISSSSDDWGTMKDRITLTNNCINILADFVAICGGFLPHSLRSLIDSLAMMCFDSILKNNQLYPILSFDSIKLALLKLGINCISVPYYDGASSPLMCIVRDMSVMLKLDRNCHVSSAAFSTLSVCNALMVPRSPPLVIVKRNDSLGTVNNNNDTANVEMKKDLSTSDDFMKKLKATIKDTESSNNKRRSDAEDHSSIVPATKKTKTIKELKETNVNNETTAARSQSKEVDNIDESKQSNNAKSDGEATSMTEESKTKNDEVTHMNEGAYITEKEDDEVVKLTNDNTTVLSKEASLDSNSDDDSMDDFPDIVDCDPDD